MLPHSLAAVGQTVRCTVTPSDGLLDGPSAQAETTIVANCPGDVNGDNMVSNEDLQAVLDGWAAHIGDPAYNPMSDFNGDGEISNFDLQQILDNWARDCD
jgi:hypothetical protein